ncbi:MAG: DHH family phosphoesterase [Candidatus Saccharimonas aalborgensis]|jgi:phosphoesterase RecJ-like protein
MYTTATSQISDAASIVIIQGENPDGDSLGSSLALEELLGERGKRVTMYCAIDMPKYLRYIRGWDRVVNEFPFEADLAIVVDTAAEALLEKCLAVPGARHYLETHPVIVLDHHGENDEDESLNDLSFSHEFVMSSSAASTGELIYELAREASWQLTPSAAEYLYISIAADTLGMTTQSATAATFQTVADLVKAGAIPAEIELRRREYMKKPADILAYKAQLIERIEYHLDGKLATVHIPWEDIAEYSDRYNPSVLVLDEMRLVEGVEVACAIKTYPDGKLTGKLRCNTPVANMIAGYFGGGGHSYAAGYKIHDAYDAALHELLTATDKALREYHDTQTS